YSVLSVSAPAITYGDNAGTISGTISYVAPSGTLIPTGNVDITVNGITQHASINSTGGSFSSVFDTHTWAANTSGYTVTFHYAGDSNFSSPNDDTGTSLVVDKATPSYSNLSVPLAASGDNTETISGKINYIAPSGTLIPTGN